MLIVYKTATGEIVDNFGTNSAMPEGPPDEVGYVNTDAAGIARDGLAVLRLHDDKDATLVADVLANRHHVDPATGNVVIDGPYESLTAAPATVAADGVDVTTVTYQAGADPVDPVTFTVDGTASDPVPLDADGAASIEVAADSPGTVTVEAAGHTVTVEAV